MPDTKRPLRLAATAALAALPLLAAAHTGADAGAHHGFAAGLLHPLTGADHLAAMLAVGVWSALAARRPRDLLWAPLGFAAMLLAGALAGRAGLALPAVEPMIAASLLVIGLLAATRLHLPGPVAAVLVGTFALFHGIAHGTELAGTAAIAGMVLATALLHGAGIAIGWLLRERAAALPRLAGAAVALFGATLLLRLA
ncbi:HupE/UreJ family protein [Pseudorhodoferax sp.]|uniref:HupE/UreJ family protein n=1 Tax=Pseudorhodoferax sp. TaxID=1993553 RepID=UPI0039E39347